MSKKNRVAIVGVGYSRSAATRPDAGQADCPGAVAAMETRVKPGDIDGLVTHSFPNQYVSSTHTAAMLGIPDLAFYSGRVDGAAYAWPRARHRCDRVGFS